MSRRASLLLLVVFTLAVYLGSAFRPALLDDADAGHAEAAKEILQRGDWVTFYINGVRYLEKAPLLFWLGAISYRIFGVNEVATRLPVLLGVLATVLVCYAFGRKLGGERAGFYSGLVFAASFGTYLFTRIFISDILLTFAVALALYCLWMSRDDARYIWGFWAALAGAVLAKGLVGMIFPLAAAGLYVLATRQWDAVRRLRPVAGAALFLLLAAPWHILASLRTPKFAWFYFVNEHFLRYLGKRYPMDYDKVPLLLFWGLMLVWLFPWSAFLPLTLRRIPSSLVTHHSSLFLWLWALVVLVFFSFGTRQEYYTMPVFPPLAILLGCGLARAEEEQGTRGGVPLQALQAVPAALGAAAGVALAVLLWISRGVEVRGDIASLLTQHPEKYRLSLGHMFDLRPETFAALRFPAAGAAVVLSLGFLLAWRLRARSRHLAATLVTAGTVAAFFYFAHAAFVTFEPYLSSKPLAMAIERARRPGDTVVIDGEYYLGSSIGFYLNSRVYLLNGRMTGLEFGSHYPDAAAVFIGDPDIQRWWQDERRVFLFTEADKLPRLKSLIPPERMYLVAQSGGKLVLSNKP